MNRILALTAPTMICASPIRPASAYPWGSAVVNDKNLLVRIAAIEVLAQLKNERGIGALKTALKDHVAEARFAAATALFQPNDPGGALVNARGAKQWFIASETLLLGIARCDPHDGWL